MIDSKMNILLFAGLGLSLQLTANLVNSPVIWVFKNLGFKPVSEFSIKSSFDFFSAIITVCLLPAVFEEVLFRKFVFNDLRLLSKKAAIVFSAVFFAFSHMSFYSFGAIFFVGLIFGILRSKDYPLIYIMIAHFCLNLSAILITMIGKTGFSPYFNKFYFLFAAASAAASVYTFKRLSNKPEQLEFNYYERPLLQFLSIIAKIPYTYIYIFIFVIIGIINL